MARMVRAAAVLFFTLTAVGAAATDGVRLTEAEGEAARYWPRRRAPSGEGLVRTGGYPDCWSESAHFAWNVPVPGRGTLSPILGRDRIFLAAACDNGAKLLPVNRLGEPVYASPALVDG